MTTMIGMDTEQVSDLARGLLADADRMDGVAGHLRGVVGQLSNHSWSGRDCADFAVGWQRVHDPALCALATKLRELGRLALVEVAEQERASGVGATLASTFPVAGVIGAAGAAGIPPGVSASTPAGVGASTPAGVSVSPLAREQTIPATPGNRHDRDLLAMATAVYPGFNLNEAGGRYRELTGEELRRLGISEQMLRDDQTGFAARIYRGDDGGTVLSFRGAR